MRTATDHAILHHLNCLDSQVGNLSHEITLALEALTVDQNRNLAIGTLLPLREHLHIATQLVDLILAVHRLAPPTEGGAS